MLILGLRYFIFVFAMIVASKHSFAADSCEITVRAAQTETIRMVLRNYKDLSTDVRIDETPAYFRFYMSRYFDSRLRARVAKDFEGIFRHHHIPVTVIDRGDFVEVQWQN